MHVYPNIIIHNQDFYNFSWFDYILRLQGYCIPCMKVLGEGGYHILVGPERDKSNLLLDGSLVNGCPWRIWVIIDAPHPACCQRGRGLF